MNWRSALGKHGLKVVESLWMDELRDHPVPRPLMPDTFPTRDEEEAAKKVADAAYIAAIALKRREWGETQLEGLRFLYKFPDGPVRLPHLSSLYGLRCHLI